MVVLIVYLCSDLHSRQCRILAISIANTVMFLKMKLQVPRLMGTRAHYLTCFLLTGPEPKEITVETFKIDHLIRTPRVEKLSLQAISLMGP